MMIASSSPLIFDMEFPERLTALRKERGMTQQALADAVGLAVLQIRRYEGGTSQPSLDALRKLAIALGVSADMLVFDPDERGPDDLLRYQFETVSRLSVHEQEVVRELLDAVIIKNQVTGAIARVNTPTVTAAVPKAAKVTTVKTAKTTTKQSSRERAKA